MMNRTALWPAGLAALLAVIVLAELVAPQDAAPALPAKSASAAATATGQDAAGLAASWSATILARPIFRPDRRPEKAAPVAAAEMPRLTAIVITQSGASAIFVADDGTATAVKPGGLVDGQVVKSITAGTVTLTSPTGDSILRPQFGAAQESSQTAPPADAPDFASELPPPGTPAVPPESPVNAGVDRDVPLAGIPNNVDRQ